MVKCNKDGQIRSHPIIKPTVLYSLYRKSSFTYQNEVPNLTKTYLKAVEPTLKKIGKQAKILEVGCGNGFMLKELHIKGYKNIWGIDPSFDAKKQADKTIRSRIKLGILSAGSFKRESFDMICLFQTLDHLPHPDKFIHLCNSLLKPGGYMIAFNHDVESFSAKLLGERSPIIDIEHIYLFSKKTIRRLFEKYGFSVENIWSPWNTLSLSHLIHLLPLPAVLKDRIKSQISVTIPLGNLCIVAKKKGKIRNNSVNI